jgi:hypothetical protein
LLAGSLTRVVVPAPEIDAAREITRAHDSCRRDLMNARHRVSTMARKHGAAAPRTVYPRSTTWPADTVAGSQNSSSTSRPATRVRRLAPTWRNRRA